MTLHDPKNTPWRPGLPVAGEQDLSSRMAVFALLLWVVGMICLIWKVF